MRSGTSESRTNPEWPGLSSGLPPDDVQSFAKDNGLETSLTSDELQMIKHGIDAGLGAARDECLDAAIGCIIDYRATKSGRKS